MTQCQGPPFATSADRVTPMRAHAHCCAQVGAPGDFGVRVHNDAEPKQARILLVSVALQGASTLVSVCRLRDEPPPYRIENRYLLLCYASKFLEGICSEVTPYTFPRLEVVRVDASYGLVLHHGTCMPAM